MINSDDRFLRHIHKSSNDHDNYMLCFTNRQFQKLLFFNERHAPMEQIYHLFFIGCLDILRSHWNGRAFVFCRHFFCSKPASHSLQ